MTILGNLALLCTLTVPWILRAQTQVVRLPYKVACDSCRIVREELFTIGTPDDSVLVGRASMLARDSRGRFFAASTSGESIIMFDSAGKFVQAVGRTGRGPGEFSRACCVLVGPADTLYVFDASGRLHVFSPQMRFVRSVPLAGRFLGWHGFVLRDGRLVLNTIVRTPANAGWPLHVLGKDGKVIRSFGADTAELRPAGDMGLRPIAMTHDQSGIWTSRLGPYRFALWDLAGDKRVDLEVIEVPGGRTGFPFPGKAGAAPAAVTYHDGAGRIWIHRLVPDPQRKPQPLRVARSGRILSEVSLNMLIDPHDLVVDVIDSETWTLLAAARFPEPGENIHGTDLYYTRKENELGIVTFNVWRLHFTKDRP